jgi:hypothetical protein
MGVGAGGAKRAEYVSEDRWQWVGLGTLTVVTRPCISRYTSIIKQRWHLLHEPGAASTELLWVARRRCSPLSPFPGRRRRTQLAAAAADSGCASGIQHPAGLATSTTFQSHPLVLFVLTTHLRPKAVGRT